MLKEGFEPIPGYRLLNFLGRGQFGEVWKATSPGGTYIALKFLNVRERQGRKEFRAIQKVKGIRYPHLVQTYALWLLDENMQVIDDAAFDSSQPILVDSVRATMMRQPLTQTDPRKPSMLVIATVLCDQNLMERLTECKKKGERGIAPQELLGYIEDAAKAIDYLNAPRHELGRGLVAIHHCDIKPENIMILGDLAVVGDFGVARILGTESHTRATTTMGGSVAYAAPETFDNRTEATSDQYSLAITYYELRTGKLPFPEESQAQVMKDKLSGRLDLTDVPVNEAKVLRRAMSVDPSKRYPSARLFVESLHVAVMGKQKSQRVSWAPLIGAALAFVAILSLVALFLRPKSADVDDPQFVKERKEVKEEEGKHIVDGVALYADALQEYRKSDLGGDSVNNALIKTVEAIREGGYIPSACNAVGMELTPVFQTNEDSLDENHCLKLIALSPDKSTLVKSVHHTLHFISLNSDVSKQVELKDTDLIAQLAWLPGEIVLLDKKQRLKRFMTKSVMSAQGGEFANDIAVPDTTNQNQWLGFGQSMDRNKLFLLSGQESKSIGTFASEPGNFQAFSYSEGGSPVPIDISTELRWKDRSPKISIDETGDHFVVCSNCDGEFGTLMQFSGPSIQSIDMATMPEIKEFQEFNKIVFLDSKGSLLMAGIARDTEEDYRLISSRIANGTVQLTKVPLPNAQPIGSICVESSEHVFVSQTTKLLRCIRDSSTGSWETKELFDFEDGPLLVGAAREFSAGRINSVCKLNERWLMTGHETGRSMIVCLESGSPAIGFEICPKLDCAIQDISLTPNQVVLVGQDGRVIWFDLAEILLNAESCKKAGVAPRASKSTSVRS